MLFRLYIYIYFLSEIIFWFQTKLHDTVCQKRQAATIATHDLASVKAPLTYDAKPPAEITVTVMEFLYINNDVSNKIDTF